MRLRQRQGQGYTEELVKARACLHSIYARFTEGFACPDLEEAAALIQAMSSLKNVRIVGLMTMGPFAGDPEDSRPYFQRTKKIFDALKAMGLPGVEMKTLSMGMSNSYKVALEEGANMVRIGTKLFGKRE